MSFAAGTEIATPQGAVAIEDLERGSMVLAGAGSAPHLTWSPVAVLDNNGTPPVTLEVCFIVFGEGRSLICTRDQAFMRSDGKLMPADGLAPSDKLLDRNGNEVQIVGVRIGQYAGSFYRIVTQPNPGDGSLILAGGVVTG